MTESNTKGLTRHLKREFRKQVFLIKNQEDINIIRGYIRSIVTAVYGFWEHNLGIQIKVSQI